MNMFVGYNSHHENKELSIVSEIANAGILCELDLKAAEIYREEPLFH